jgi:transcriptional regulator with XRE-family HTH domain
MDATNLQQKLGQAIRAHRERRKFSQEDFADAIGMHRAYYGAIERGLKNLTLRNIARVAEGLGVTPAKLFADAERFE